MPKNLVVLCDGTWQSDAREYATNVRLFRDALRPSDGAGQSQCVFYDAGVGTGNWWNRLVGGLTGIGIYDNVRQAYGFLVQHYEPGDRLHLFGFSRGAYTVRSLAGLIGSAGIVDRGTFGPAAAGTLSEAVAAAHAHYREPSKKPGGLRAGRWAAHFRHDIRIHVLGVWDTVGALGVPIMGPRSLLNRRFHFHDVKLGRRVDNAYHAVSIDERRQPFKATLWRGPPRPGQTVEQAWFAGDHAGVGGGSEIDGLSNIALHWMIGKARQHGLAFHDAMLVRPDLAGDVTAPCRDAVFGLVRLLGTHDRDVLDPGYVGQCVHRSVDEKTQRDPGYRPDNLPPGWRDHPSCARPLSSSASAGPGS